MGCCVSAEYHDQERGITNRALKKIVFTEQPSDVMGELDTDNDQKGRVAVDHIFRPTREVYGQPPEDMKQQKIDWADYSIVAKERPHPHDFPAFAHEKPLFTNKGVIMPS
uniref:Small lipoprotein YifL n=1 Tax=Steinernema glaseri TaxID=37863 RepID=A0A1I8ACI9_9BILA